MKKLIAAFGAVAATTLTAVSAQASDVVVMKFTSNECSSCAVMESQVDTAIAMVGSDKVRAVTVDVSNAALWEKGAHDAFNENVVPVFNQYVGLTGLTVIVDRQTRQPIGCVNGEYDANSVADFLKRAAGVPHQSNASVRVENFRCPPAHNKF